jgi:hypothetical protein
MVGCRLLSSNPLLVESFAYHTALALSQRSQSRYRKNFPFLFLARFLLFLLLIHSSYVFASRPNGALLGDKGTRFFHATTVCRRQRNRIQRLRLENGEWGSDDDIVKGSIFRHFQSLFCSVESIPAHHPPLDNHPCISSAQADLLIAPVSK